MKTPYPNIVVQHEHNKNLIVLDIDGCLVDSFDRLPHLLQGDRQTYDALHPTDTSIQAGVQAYRMFLNSNHLCLFVTSRSACARDYTEAQLEQALGMRRQQFILLMRPLGCDDHDVDLKPRLIQEAGYKLDDILLVVEDGEAMVKHWRSLGITVWQTLPGASAVF